MIMKNSDTSRFINIKLKDYHFYISNTKMTFYNTKTVMVAIFTVVSL